MHLSDLANNNQALSYHIALLHEGLSERLIELNVSCHSEDNEIMISHINSTISTILYMLPNVLIMT